MVDDQTFVRQVVGAFLKVFDDIKLKDDAVLQLSAQNPPDIVVIDEDEFHKRVAEHEANRQRIKRISKSLDKAAG
jgi:PHD/YefM family antitoxin component YafN of YafNO toxin-antitoxin module